jgi:dihydrofolate synthase/folylpolyglutamate synthase
LGETRTKIAGEKAGIIKKSTPVLIAERDSETQAVFETKIQQETASLRWVNMSELIESDLLGNYQQLNLNTAKQAFEWYCEIQNIVLQNDSVSRALKNVAKLTDFHGRMELVQVKPSIILDVAHNSAGVFVLFNSLKKIQHHKLHCVFGNSNDKDLGDIIPLLPKDASYYFTTFRNSRSRNADEWRKIGHNFFPKYMVFNNPLEALESAKDNAHINDLIVVFGSFFLVGELVEKFRFTDI